MTLREIGEHIEQYFIEIIRERRKAPFDSFVKGLLFVASRFYLRAINTRIWLYDNRVIRYRAIGCLVVSIGNLTCGGTGKTPIVEIFARTLSQKGRRVAVLSRGYRSKDKRGFFEKLRKRLFSKKMEVPPRVVSDGKRVLLDSSVAGDEPFMLARNLPGVIVIVDKNRVRAGHYAITEFGADTLVLDDGFQYLPLRGQIQLLLVDKTNPFGNKHLLPRGILREPISHLKRASYIFLTKSDGEKDYELEQTIRRFNNTAEIIECAHKLRYLVDFSTGEKFELSTLDGRKVACFSAIAAPESFERFLRDFGAKLVLRKRFLDHHRFTTAELDEVFSAAARADAEFVVTTEKDSVRIAKDYSPRVRFFYTKLEIDILSGADDFENAVERICFPKRKADEIKTPDGKNK